MNHRSPPNPLRRAADRTRRWWHAALFLGLLAAIGCGVAAGLAAWNADSRAAREQAAHLHRITATTVADAERRLGGRVSGGPEATARAVWQYPAATRHTGTLAVPAQTPAGRTVQVWVDDAGREAQAPRSGNDIAVSAFAAGTWAAGLIALAATGVVHLGLHQLDARALDAWERDWARVEPRWSGRLRSGPGAEDD
ncbi:hypothetical protein ABZZ20_26745 [Streptomyces sp. NPDC006430]|uniref:Rv1733c family protein n=1 Tax=Streptomyces sp. NPDC006430 TaxID=3154299 RepID=UPI0033B86587